MGVKKLLYLTEIATYFESGTRQVHGYCRSLIVSQSICVRSSDLEKAGCQGSNFLTDLHNYACTFDLQ